jgi:hypothetical protein
VGTEITRESFEAGDDARSRDRLQRCLAELGRLLARPGFGVGPATIGAELELFLVDRSGLPLPRNQAVRAAAADPRVTLELDRFNLELNASPVPLAGRPFAALGEELDLLLTRTAAAAGAHQGRIALIGILPTLGGADLGHGSVTDAARYRALDRGLQRLRRGPFRIQIAGQEPLRLDGEHVAVEGANSSFQVHLRVDPAEFTRIYNAAQLATAPVLAACGNSPTFLGHLLWEETRIALFKQAVDDRDGREPRRRPSRATLGTGWLRDGPLELFAESVRLHQPLLPLPAPAPSGALEPGGPAGGGPAGGGPAGGALEAGGLEALRLHHGTVWSWNRAIYDPGCGGHLRIEMRALPAGPTVADMLANAAFLIGLTLWLARRDPRWTYTVPFERADHGFYRAAQHGLAAELTWPSWRGQRVRTVRAADLVPELLPAARHGLLDAGVAAAEADRLLAVIGARVATGQTGAAWQRAALAAAERPAEPGRSRQHALAVMLDRYLNCAATGHPVHTWPLR